MKQGRCPSPRNHPALRRILGEEVPHLVPPPPLHPVSVVCGWGEALKKEKAAETNYEAGTATGTETSSRSATNFVAGRKRSRFRPGKNKTRTRMTVMMMETMEELRNTKPPLLLPLLFCQLQI